MTRLSRYAVALLLTVSVLAVVPGAASALPDGDGSVTCGGASSWSPADSGYTADSNETVRVIIRFEESAPRSCIASAVSAVDGEIVGGEDVDIVPVAVAEVDPEAMAALRARSDIRAVQRDRIGHATGFGDEPVTDGDTVESDSATASDGTVGSGDDTASDGTAGSGDDTATGDADAVGSASAQETPWGIDRINATRAAATVPDSSMRDVQVAVMDTGIDLDHPDLQDNLVWGTDHIDGNDREGLQYTDDVNGHGTHVAGTIAARDNSEGVVGVAPNVELYSVRVLNDSGIGYYSWWIEGIDRAVKGPDGRIGTADDPDVISMSLGGQSSTPALADAVERASDHAVLIAAAGNYGDGDPATNDVDYPAKYPETVTVAATDTDDSTLFSSAEGAEVDIAAPGYRITSTTDPDHTSGSEYGPKSGTSMATPHVSGTAALLIAQDLADGARDLSDAAVEQRLYDNATDIHGPGEDRYSGHGRLRAAASLGAATSDPPTATFSLSPTSLVAGQSVTLDASASTDDEGIVTYDWDVGGTSFSTTTATATTPIQQSGVIDVTLTVTDADGQTDSVTQTVLVEQNDPPTAAFTLSPDPPHPGRPLTLDASNSTDDGGIVSYNWTVAGQRTNATDPTRTVAALPHGTHDVTLTVVDGSGRTNSTTRTVTVPAALSLSNAPLVSPIRVDETVPVRTTATVTDVVPNDTVNGTLSLSVGLNGNIAATSNATVRDGERTALSVPVTPSTPGTYTVSVDGELSVNGSTFTAQGDTAQLEVLPATESVVPAFAGTAPPTDVDGDLLLEDVDGDGNATRADAMAYYDYRKTSAIRDNPARFDFDGDGVAGTVSDALALFEEVA